MIGPPRDQLQARAKSNIAKGNHPTMSRTGPSNVIPLLGAARAFGGCDPLQLALALRRVHAAGLRRDFVLLAPSRLSVADIGWWTAACHAIVEQTRLWIGLVEPSDREADAMGAPDRMSGRIRVIPDLAPEARAGVIELSRGVVSDDRGFLTEAEAMGIPGHDRAGIEAAVGGRHLSALFERPIRAALLSSA